MLVGGVLLERRSLGGRLEVLEANLALDALCQDVLSHEPSADWVPTTGIKCVCFLPEEDRRRARRVFRKSAIRREREKKTYGFELRLCDAAGIFGIALALRGCFCSVAHDCDVCFVFGMGGVECGDGVWRFICS